MVKLVKINDPGKPEILISETLLIVSFEEFGAHESIFTQKKKF